MRPKITKLQRLKRRVLSVATQETPLIIMPWKRLVLSRIKLPNTDPECPLSVKKLTGLQHKMLQELLLNRKKWKKMQTEKLPKERSRLQTWVTLKKMICKTVNFRLMLLKRLRVKTAAVRIVKLTTTTQSCNWPQGKFTHLSQSQWWTCPAIRWTSTLIKRNARSSQKLTSSVENRSGIYWKGNASTS